MTIQPTNYMNSPTARQIVRTFGWPIPSWALSDNDYKLFTGWMKTVPVCSVCGDKPVIMWAEDWYLGLTARCGKKQCQLWRRTKPDHDIWWILLRLPVPYFLHKIIARAWAQ